MADLYAEWEKLCDEHEAARDAYLDAFEKVHQRFVTVDKGASRVNPTGSELDDFEVSWKKWEDVKARMDVFVKKNA